jgi:hypothetical protein
MGFKKGKHGGSDAKEMRIQSSETARMRLRTVQNAQRFAGYTSCRQQSKKQP